jgi:hypothetical protein
VPEGFDNIYPLFFAGDELVFCITTLNQVTKKFGDMSLVAYQNILRSTLTAQGAPLGPANMQDGICPVQAGHGKNGLRNFYDSGYGDRPALAQTHIRLSKGSLAESNPKHLLVEDFMAQIWTFMKP